MNLFKEGNKDMDDERMVAQIEVYHYPKVADIHFDECFFNFIDESFLDGYINHVNIQQVRIYPNRSGESVPSKEELESLYRGEMHTKFISGKIDNVGAVLIFATSRKYHWFFLYEADNSDCCIGRVLKKNFSEEQFRHEVLEQYDSHNTSIEVDKSLFIGMLSW